MLPGAMLHSNRVLLWLGASGLVIRMIYFSEHAGSAFFDVPILDEKYYDAVARALAEGRSAAEINPGFRPLFYPVLLALAYLLAGPWATAVAIAAQHLLGIATALIVAVVATRLYNRPEAGAWAGGLYLLAGPPLFFEGELLITSLFTFLVAVLLFLLCRLTEDGPATLWFAAGLAAAVASQARPNVLVVLLAFPLFAVIWRRGRFRGRASLAALALAGAFSGLLAFGLVQSRFTGHFQWLGGAGGVNFYLGNKQGADGRVPRQDRSVTYGEEYRDSVQVFAEEVYREETGAVDVSPGRVSRYWLGRTFGEIDDDPAAWTALMARKAWYLAWNREIPNNKSFSFIREHESMVLRVAPVRWWLLFALAPIGAWFARDRRLLLWLCLFIGLYAGGVVLFFVNSRYRVPLWPAMAVLAGGGLMALAGALRERRYRELAAVAVAAVLALVSLVNWLGIPPDNHARDFFFRSIAQLEKGRLEEAADDARRSVELEPGDAAAHFQLGTVSLARQDGAAAVASFRRAAELEPREPRIWNNLGVALERLDRPGDAYQLYLRAIELTADYPPPLVNAALLELRAGRVDDAEAKVRRASDLRFESVSFYCALALVERQRGHDELSRQALARARERDAETVRQLLEENRRPLPPEALAP